MRSCLWSLLAIGLFLTVAADVTGAAEVLISAAEANVYQRIMYVDMRTTVAVGLVAIAEVERKSFIVVDLELRVNWDAKTSFLSIKKEKISLSLGAGRSAPAIATVKAGHVTMLTRLLSTLSFYRPSQWPKVRSSVYKVTYVFVAPFGPTKATVKVGEARRQLQLGNSRPLLELTHVPRAKVTGARYVESIRNARKAGSELLTVTHIPFAGKLLEVKATILPSGPNTGGKYFYFRTRWLGVRFTVGGKASHVVAAGQIGDEGFRVDWLYTIKPNDRTKKWSAERHTLYFVVPDGASDLKLTYLSQPVADVAVAP